MAVALLAFCTLVACAAQSGKQSAKASPGEEGMSREQAAKIVEELQMIRMLLETEIDRRPAGADGQVAQNRSAKPTVKGLSRGTRDGQ